MVRYWEGNPDQVKAVIRNLRENGAESVAIIVPWAHLATDRHQRLFKLIRSVNYYDLRLRIIVTPELGSGFPNAGIPDNIQREAKYWAKDRFGQTFYNTSPPNMHPLVNLGHHDVFQKFGHFLLKFVQELSTVLFECDQLPIELVVTDSLYRHYQITGSEEFGAHNENSFSEREFVERSCEFLQSKLSQFGNVQVTQKKLFSREASLGRLLEEINGGRVAFAELVKRLTQKAPLNSGAWFDSLRGLKEKERNFLLSASLVLCGDVFLSQDDFLELKSKYRLKLQKFMRDLRGKVETYAPVLALVEDVRKCSEEVQEMQNRLGQSLKILRGDASLYRLAAYQLAVVDKSLKVSQELLEKFIDTASDHPVTIAFHRESLDANAAKLLHAHRTFQITHEWAFEVAIFQNAGKIVIYDEEKRHKQASEKLIDRLLKISEIRPLCKVNHRDIVTVVVRWQESDLLKTVFILNTNHNAQKIDIRFAKEIELFGVSLQKNPGNAHGLNGSGFSAEIPGLAVIPMNMQDKLNLPLAESAERAESIASAERAESVGSTDTVNGANRANKDGLEKKEPPGEAAGNKESTFLAESIRKAKPSEESTEVAASGMSFDHPERAVESEAANIGTVEQGREFAQQIIDLAKERNVRSST